MATAIDKNSASASDIAALRKTLPPTWEIDTPEAHYEFSSEPLRELLECGKCDAAAQKSRLLPAEFWAYAVAAQVDGYSAPVAPGGPDPHAALAQILQRREFGAVHPPSQWDILRQRINEWLERMLARLFQHIGNHPMGIKLFFWLILFGVTGWLAMMLVRFWLARARVDQLQAVGQVAFARSWQEWIHAAKEAAARGDFREAIHSVYWAGIAHLEDDGLLTRDRTRTPREHLRLVSEALAALPGASQRRDRLATLTSLFERIWYGRGPADARDFQTSLQEAEGLGCHLP
ncbi:MAG: DUF4129 domain-containing protein [Candidatus Acidiferrales bacterium]